MPSLSTAPPPATPFNRLRARALADPVLTAALIVLGVGSASIAGAWTMELGFGLVPCPLCLAQRVPYYIALPLAAVIALLAWRVPGRGLLRIGLIALAGLMLWGATVAAFHAGVEWKWWPGPTDCASVPMRPIGSVNDLLSQMQATRLVRCDEPAWVFLGLSLAGWNALITLGLAGVALWGAVAGLRRHGSSSVSQ